MSEVQICNLALTRIGVDLITSLDDPQKQAQICKVHYPQARDTVLEKRTWRFATARTTLTPLLEEPEFEWNYQFLLPADCLMVQKVWKNNSSHWEHQINWQREGEVILADDEEIYVIYTRQITDTQKFSPGFTTTVSLRLAYELATGLRANQSLRKEVLAEYFAALRSAGAREGRQGRTRDFIPPKLVRDRR